ERAEEIYGIRNRGLRGGRMATLHKAQLGADQACHYRVRERSEQSPSMDFLKQRATRAFGSRLLRFHVEGFVGIAHALGGCIIAARGCNCCEGKKTADCVGSSPEY